MYFLVVLPEFDSIETQLYRDVKCVEKYSETKRWDLVDYPSKGDR